MKASLNITLIVLIVVGLGYATLQVPALLGESSEDSASGATHVVQRRTIEDRVVERGTIESQKTVYGKCEIPGRNKITFIVPEGTAVKKGDKVIMHSASGLDFEVPILKQLKLDNGWKDQWIQYGGYDDEESNDEEGLVTSLLADSASGLVPANVLQQQSYLFKAGISEKQAQWLDEQLQQGKKLSIHACLDFEAAGGAAASTETQWGLIEHFTGQKRLQYNRPCAFDYCDEGQNESGEIHLHLLQDRAELKTFSAGEVALQSSDGNWQLALGEKALRWGSLLALVKEWLENHQDTGWKVKLGARSEEVLPKEVLAETLVLLSKDMLGLGHMRPSSGTSFLEMLQDDLGADYQKLVEGLREVEEKVNKGTLAYKKDVLDKMREKLKDAQQLSEEELAAWKTVIGAPQETGEVVDQEFYQAAVRFIELFYDEECLGALHDALLQVYMEVANYGKDKKKVISEAGKQRKLMSFVNHQVLTFTGNLYCDPSAAGSNIVSFETYLSKVVDSTHYVSHLKKALEGQFTNRREKNGSWNTVPWPQQGKVAEFLGKELQPWCVDELTREEKTNTAGNIVLRPEVKNTPQPITLTLSDVSQEYEKQLESMAGIAAFVGVKGQDETVGSFTKLNMCRVKIPGSIGGGTAPKTLRGDYLVPSLIPAINGVAKRVIEYVGDSWAAPSLNLFQDNLDEAGAVAPPVDILDYLPPVDLKSPALVYGRTYVFKARWIPNCGYLRTSGGVKLASELEAKDIKSECSVHYLRQNGIGALVVSEHASKYSGGDTHQPQQRPIGVWGQYWIQSGQWRPGDSQWAKHTELTKDVTPWVKEVADSPVLKEEKDDQTQIETLILSSATAEEGAFISGIEDHTFYVRKPQVAIDDWLAWVLADCLDETTKQIIPTKTDKCKKLLEKVDAVKTKIETLPTHANGYSCHVDEPAISNTLLVEVYNIANGTAQRQVIAKEMVDFQVPEGQAWEADEIEFVVQSGEKAAITVLIDEKGNRKVEVTLPEGGYRVVLSTAVANKYVTEEKDKRFGEGVFNDDSEYSKDLKGDLCIFEPNYQLNIEVASADLPTEEKLWKAVRLNATNRQLSLALAYEKKSGVGMRNVSRVQVRHQEWAWQGRMEPQDPVPYRLAANGNDVVGDPEKETSKNQDDRGDWANGKDIRDWEEIAFIEKPDSEYFAEETTLSLLEEGQELAAYSYDYSGDLRGLYHRLGVEVHSRYESIMTGNSSTVAQVKASQPRSSSGAIGEAGAEMSNDRENGKDEPTPDYTSQWKAIYLPQQIEGELSKPSVRLILPLTGRYEPGKSFEKEEEKNEAGLASSVMVVFSHVAYAEAGLPETVEGEIVEVEHRKVRKGEVTIENRYQEAGYDPIISCEGLPEIKKNEHSGKEEKPWKLKMVGPLGHTFDLGTRRRRSVATSYMLTLHSNDPKYEPREWAMAKIRFQKKIRMDGSSGKTVESGWAPGQWLQFLPDMSALQPPKRGKLDHANQQRLNIRTHQALHDALDPMLPVRKLTKGFVHWLVLTKRIRDVHGKMAEVYYATLRRLYTPDGKSEEWEVFCGLDKEEGMDVGNTYFARVLKLQVKDVEPEIAESWSWDMVFGNSTDIDEDVRDDAHARVVSISDYEPFTIE